MSTLFPRLHPHIPWPHSKGFPNEVTADIQTLIFWDVTQVLSWGENGLKVSLRAGLERGNDLHGGAESLGSPGQPQEG